MWSWIQQIPMSMLETVGFFTGVACVVLAGFNSIWNWPIAMISTLAYMIFFNQYHLYSDAGLQVLFLFMQIYGWAVWSKKSTEKQTISILNKSQLFYTLWIIVGTTLVWGLLLPKIKPEQIYPFWDAVTTCISISAIILQAQKKIENWLLWILADLLYIPLYLKQKMMLTALLYVIFLILAVWGAWKWKKSLQKERSTND